jgi:hypothetical protein
LTEIYLCHACSCQETLRTETAGQDPCQADAHTGNTSVNIVSSGMDFIRSAHRDGVPFYVNIWLHVSHNRLDPTAAQKAAAGPVCKQAELATNQTECAERVFIAAQQDADAQIGRLDAMLGELDLHESTLILFSTARRSSRSTPTRRAPPAPSAAGACGVPARITGWPHSLGPAPIVFQIMFIMIYGWKTPSCAREHGCGLMTATNGLCAH